MKILLISLSTPTPFNCGAASALPYHLAKYRPDDVDLEIYSFNINHVRDDMQRESEAALGAKIHIIPLPRWYKWLMQLHLLLVRVFVTYPILAYLRLPAGVEKRIKEDKPDAIWIYGEDLSHIADCFKGKRCVVTSPDCEALYYYRELAHKGNFTHFLPLMKYALMYGKYARMAEDFPTANVRYHLVGKEDCDFLKNINPTVDATFIHHPHYDYSDRKVIRFSHPKIKLLVAGRYDFYMQDKCDEVFNALVDNAAVLKKAYRIMFLGKNWESWSEKLRVAGFEVDCIRFAPSYMEELIKHDIQLTPIGVGTGTKGKVLDALANGLLVMGTERALENIRVVSGESCILYRQPQEAISVLMDIPNRIPKYEAIAEAGRKAVLESHDRRLVAEQFFGLFE